MSKSENKNTHSSEDLNTLIKQGLNNLALQDKHISGMGSVNKRLLEQEAETRARILDKVCRLIQEEDSKGGSLLNYLEHLAKVTSKAEAWQNFTLNPVELMEEITNKTQAATSTLDTSEQIAA